MRSTALVLEEAVESDELGLGAAGAGLLASCPNVRFDRKTQAATAPTYTQTLMLTPNLPFLRFLETVSAVNRNAVLVVIAQEQVRILARALITDTKSDVGR